jgi:hypothetical protein
VTPHEDLPKKYNVEIAMKLKIMLLLFFAFSLGYGNAHAESVTTRIKAYISSIEGYQQPTNLEVGDPIAFSYTFDDAGNRAHRYYVDGGTETVPITAYPALSTLSDAETGFSDNLLAAFAEFTGNSTYQAYNSHWVWTVKDSGMRILTNCISPSVLVYLGYTPGDGVPKESTGHIKLWSQDQTVTMIKIQLAEVRTLSNAP